MFRANFLILSFLLSMIFAQEAFAQTVSGKSAFFTSQVLTIYFLMLLFATIINRILEYSKLMLMLLDRKHGLLRRFGETLFETVKTKLDGLGISYDAEALRRRLNQMVLFTVMQLGAFVLGILLAYLLRLDVFTVLQINLGKPYAYLVTGLIIGAGVEPVHSFFRIAQEKRKIKKLLTRSGLISESKPME